MLNSAAGIDAASLRLESEGRRSSAPLKIVGSETAYQKSGLSVRGTSESLL
jgi:hypothetical protein